MLVNFRDTVRQLGYYLWQSLEVDSDAIRSMAVHEAGHAVIAFRHKFCVNHIRLNITYQHINPGDLIAWVDIKDTLEISERSVKLYLAGRAAEEILGASYYLFGNGNDREMVQQIMELLFQDDPKMAEIQLERLEEEVRNELFEEMDYLM
jgi:hypothetical protein